MMFKPPKNSIDMPSQAWPNPSQPVKPVGPPDSQPLLWQFNFGQNLIYTPRPDAQYAAADLKLMSEYPLARICIENTKDLICQMPFRIQSKSQPGEPKKDRLKREAKDPQIAALMRMFEYPDGTQPWSDWLRPLIEDLLVIDAPAILMQRTMKRTIARLIVIPGDNIARYIDENGFTPQPPNPAYAQLWDGIPRIDLTTDDLLYRPRNICRRNTMSSQLYGFGPTEQTALEIKVGIARLNYVWQYYASGNVPNAMQVVPLGTDPGKALEAQLVLNSELGGQLDKRRTLRMVQGFAKEGEKEQFVFPAEPKLADMFDEVHIKKICFAYGTSPQRLMRQMNRASAEQADEAAQTEGIEPFVGWVESTMNYLIQVKMGFAQYEFVIDRAREPDMLKQAQALNIVAPTFVSINEGREQLGLDPDPKPEANMRGKFSPTGAFVPLGEVPPTPAPFGSPAPPAKPAAPGNQPSGNPKTALAKGNDNEPRIDPSDLSRVDDARRALYDELVKFFSDQKASATRRVRSLFKVAKADQLPEESDAVDAIMDFEWYDLVSSTDDPLYDAGKTGALRGLEQLAVTDRAAIVTAQKLAREYSLDRAAEMVGMKWVDGELIDNPNAKWAITTTTRNKIRALVADAFSRETPLDALVKGIQETDAFSDSRADMIARTEVTRAQSRGNLQAWLQTGVVQTVRWMLSADHDEPDECDLNAAVGEIEVGKAFPSGDTEPGAHPRCRCVLVIGKLKPKAQMKPQAQLIPAVAAAYRPNGAIKHHANA